MLENFVIQLYDSFHIKVIGSPGKKLLTSMFLEYYDAKILEITNNSEDSVDLCIFLGSVKDHNPYETVKKYKTTPFLIGILSKKDYNFITEFCKENNLRLYIAPTKKIFTYYKYLNFPMFDYIHLSLALSTSALSKQKILTDSVQTGNQSLLEEFKTSIVNVDYELLQRSPIRDETSKPFHIRSFQNPELKHLTFVWEPGTKMVGNKIMMEWIRDNILKTFNYESSENSKDSEGSKELQIHTIIDIDEIYETSDMKEYLLPFTILGIHQKSILIVNTEFEDSSSEESESEDFKPFDYHIYTNIMELWNNKHYIPKKLSLLESTILTLDSSDLKIDSKIFELDRSIKNPPIFILDNFDSIYNYISKINKKSIILYIGKEENFKKFV
jgi:hypothetical protein